MNLSEEDRQWISSQIHETEQRLVETMRTMQTELLRGFAAFSEGMTIRVRKLEADQSNLDAALSGRVDVVERGCWKSRRGSTSSHRNKPILQWTEVSHRLNSPE